MLRLDRTLSASRDTRLKSRLEFLHFLLAQVQAQVGTGFSLYGRAQLDDL